MLPGSPIRKLALPQFMKDFGDLVGGSLELGPYEFELISATHELVFFGHYTSVQRSSLIRTGRLVAKLMADGAVIDLCEVATALLLNVERVPRQLNRGWQLLTDAQAAEDEDVYTERFLIAYKTLYESVLPALLAPVVVGLGLTTSSKRKFYSLDRDGRAKLAALHRIQHYSQFPRKQLSIGLNSHVRNAYSHDRYTILDQGQVKLWDVDPHSGKLSWGPETWPLRKLAELCEELWRNCLGIAFGIATFSLGHRHSIEASGLYESVESIHDPVRADELRHFIEHLGRYRGFEIDNFQYENGTLRLQLRTNYPGVDQNSEILVGLQGGGSRRYSVSMKHYEQPVAAQVLGLLQETHFQTQVEFAFEVVVLDPDRKNLGKIEGNSGVLIQPKGTGLEVVRSLMTVDTLGDSRMTVVVEGYPMEQ